MSPPTPPLPGQGLRLLILTQYFPPETGAPQARLSETALRLRELGVAVEVLTAMPSYPLGRTYEGWRGRLCMRDHWRDLPVLRAWAYATQSPRAVPRLASYFSFVLSSLLVGLFGARRFDVVLVESPPLFLGLSGVALAWLRRARLVLNVSDLWPETAVALGLYARDSRLVRLAETLERWLYRRASAVTAQSPGIQRGVLAKHPAARVEWLPGGVDAQLFAPAHRDPAVLAPFGCAGKKVVGYAGLIGIAQGIELILQVAQRLQAREDIVFLIAGDGPERAALQARAGRNVRFTGLLPKASMPAVVASFDLTLIPLVLPIPGALPSKMYEAMAAQVPIVLAAEGDARELLTRAGCGLHAPYADAEAVARAVLQLCDAPEQAQALGRAGRNYVLAHHVRTVIAEKMLGVLLAARRERAHDSA